VTRAECNVCSGPWTNADRARVTKDPSVALTPIQFLYSRALSQDDSGHIGYVRATLRAGLP